MTVSDQINRHPVIAGAFVALAFGVSAGSLMKPTDAESRPAGAAPQIVVSQASVTSPELAGGPYAYRAQPAAASASGDTTYRAVPATPAATDPLIARAAASRTPPPASAFAVPKPSHYPTVDGDILTADPPMPAPAPITDQAEGQTGMERPSLIADAAARAEHRSPQD